METNTQWFIRGKQGCAELIKKELIKRGGIIDIDNYEYSDNDCLYFIVDKMILCKFSQSNGGKYMIEHWEEIEVKEVDINKEISQFIDAYFEKATIGHKLSLRRTAKYFFELGRKVAQKGE